MNFEEDLAIENILRYSIGIIKLKYLQHLSLNKIISLDENLKCSKKQTRYDKIKSNKYVDNEIEVNGEKIQFFKEDTPITVIEKCLLYGLNREEALQVIKDNFKLTEKEILEVLKKELILKNNLRTTKNGEIYLADKKEGMEY